MSTFTLKAIKNWGKEVKENIEYRFENGVTMWSNGHYSNKYDNSKDFFSHSRGIYFRKNFMLVSEEFSAIEFLKLLINDKLPEGTIVNNHHDKYEVRNKTLYLQETNEEVTLSFLTDPSNQFKIYNDYGWKWDYVDKFTKVQVRNTLKEKWINRYFISFNPTKLKGFTVSSTLEDNFIGSKSEDNLENYKYCRFYYED